jgi:FMN-dependent NADH-azoreductase
LFSGTGSSYGKRERRHFNLDFKIEVKEPWASENFAREVSPTYPPEEKSMTLFRLDASIRVEGSASREIADIVEQEWLAAHPGDTIERRHIGVDPIPATAWPTAVSALYVADEDRTPEQRDAIALAASLVDELLAADAILFAVPLYNYGVSQHIKTYFDLILTDPRAGEAGNLLAGKRVVLATVRGGAYGEGTPRHGWDHSTPYLRRILEDVWKADLTVVEREFTLVGVSPGLDAFTEQAAEMHKGALESAREAGRALGAAPAVV